jgi:prophage maintenance system killer protein
LAAEAETVDAVLALAMGEMDEDNFSNWLTEHSTEKLGSNLD